MSKTLEIPCIQNPISRINSKQHNESNKFVANQWSLI